MISVDLTSVDNDDSQILQVEAQFDKDAELKANDDDDNFKAPTCTPRKSKKNIFKKTKIDNTLDNAVETQKYVCKKQTMENEFTVFARDVRNFLPSWTIEYGFIKYGDKSRCGLYSEIIVSRTSSIKRHFETNHKEILELNITERKEVISQRLKVIENQSNLLCKFVKTSNNVTEASFEISHLIAKHSKPFCEGEFLKTVMLKAAPSLFQDFNNKDKILQRIQELQLSRNTIKERILKMTVNISDQLQSDINSCDFFSICLDETTDIKSSARLAIFARFSNGNEMREELLKLANIPERTRGTDHVGHPIIGFHCIIHQQMLCSKVGTSDLKELSEQVNKIINFIVARDMHKRQFKKILNDVNCEYDTLLLCNNVRWLSRATSLERFVNYLTLHLNTLNKKLQGRGKTIARMALELPKEIPGNPEQEYWAFLGYYFQSEINPIIIQ
ncbi:zinc finger BED domain-containing protein 5-like [Melanaphis sacchari]|uniref:zinc finger BED domain-containing protein 5-like n=1 Tax=Melanaphis sacchari TaxID=742174 RepID=UPI000DC15086|nr:zinc finger BED domain-containing protein 5-like [Melanaphis sacchari]